MGILIDRAWLVIPVFLVGINLLRGIGYLVGSYGLAYVSSYLVHALRTDIFEKYLQLPCYFFDRSMSGHLVSVVTFNVQQVTQACTKALKTLPAGQPGDRPARLPVLCKLEADSVLYCGYAIDSTVSLGGKSPFSPDQCQDSIVWAM